MKITAVFPSADSADAALSRLREAGISLHKAQTKPLRPPRDPDAGHFMLFPSAYEAGMMLYPFMLPDLEHGVVRLPLGEAEPDAQTVLSAQIGPEDAARSREILINGHAASVRLS